MMRVGIVGADISGLVSAYVLAKAGVQVVLYERHDHLDKTFTVDGITLDLRTFMLFNRVTHPDLMEFFDMLEVEMENSNMSFSVSLDDGHGYEWGTQNGLSSLFLQKRNLLNPHFWHMLWEVNKFSDDALRYLQHDQDISHGETLQGFINSRGYSEMFQKAYLVPICCSVWPCPVEQVISFSAFLVLSFFQDHQNLWQLFGHPQRLTVKSPLQNFIKKIKEALEHRGCQIRTSCSVQSVSKLDDGCLIICEDGSQEKCNGCIITTHAPDALRMLGEQASYEENRILGAFNYVYSDIFLHHDKKFMPQNQRAWSAWNFHGTVENKICLTYWLNAFQQNIDDKGPPLLVTINPSQKPESRLFKLSTRHPVPSLAASKASLELINIQGKRGIWFCGAYQGYGFHEDGVKAGIATANGLLNTSCEILNNPKHIVPSLMEAGCRSFIVRFLQDYMVMGTLILIEEGGTVFTFEGTSKKSSLRVYLKVHNPQFYWKIVTKADLGLADSYMDGDFSFIDKNEGLLNMLMLFALNNDAQSCSSKISNRGWWTPIFVTAGISSAKYFYHHVMRKNSLTQARRNISRHYDLSNKLFSLFLDETMTYSCAVFKREDEDLKEAQMRKISSLISKARVEKTHEVLEIGCGWGSLAIELVKRTGCKYTGITLSQEQLRYAETKVKEAGLQEHMKFLLCDYRQLKPDTCKYNRIISCEMIEAVGHEYMEEFFGCCESLLAEDGLFVLQFISVPESKYDEYRNSTSFLKEYIFPGLCVPSLGRVTSAMAASSKLCVEHVENIGNHYFKTLRCWRANFLKNQSEILSLGFNEHFIRAWEYYFDYVAAVYKIRLCEDYQVVFSRPGNVAVLGDPYKGVTPASYYSSS